MIQNVFQIIEDRLNSIESLLSELTLSDSKDKQNPVSDLLTVDEAAEMLHLSKPTVYTKCSRNELPYMKRGKRLYFSREELHEYLLGGKVRTIEDIEANAADNLLKKKGGAL